MKVTRTIFSHMGHTSEVYWVIRVRFTHMTRKSETYSNDFFYLSYKCTRMTLV